METSLFAGSRTRPDGVGPTPHFVMEQSHSNCWSAWNRSSLSQIFRLRTGPTPHSVCTLDKRGAKISLITFVTKRCLWTADNQIDQLTPPLGDDRNRNLYSASSGEVPQRHDDRPIGLYSF